MSVKVSGGVTLSLMMGEFYDCLMESVRDKPYEVRVSCMEAFREAEMKVQDKRVFTEFFDYETEVGFYILGLDNVPISGRVSMDNMKELAARMDRVRGIKGR